MRYSTAAFHLRAPSSEHSSIGRTSYARKFRQLLVGASVLGGLLAAAHLTLSGRLLINYTPSIPRGLYWITPSGPPRVGELVAFPIPESVRDLMYSRQYVHRSIRLLAKPVLAVAGDDVCVRGGCLHVNGAPHGTILDVDPAGRALPHYDHCGVLSPGQLYVATEHERSFDSRYFGPIDSSRVLGTLSPLVTF